MGEDLNKTERGSSGPKSNSYKQFKSRPTVTSDSDSEPEKTRRVESASHSDDSDHEPSKKPKSSLLSNVFNQKKSKDVGSIDENEDTSASKSRSDKKFKEKEKNKD